MEEVATLAHRHPRRALSLAVAMLAAAAVTVLVLPPGAALAHVPYPDPSVPVATRVSQLMANMTLDEKIGQMTQAERSAVTNADITNYALGSLLSGGGSAPCDDLPAQHRPRRGP